MTNKELKEKLIGIIRQGFIDADCRKPYTNEPYPFFDSQIFCIADALIDAGLRFGESLTATFDHMAFEREHELERRAEIAERALNDCVEYYSYSALCPVLDCNYNKACWRKECTSDIVECFKIQAEEELKKESKS